MRFNPANFIDLCRRADIDLRREGPFLCYDTGRKWHGGNVALEEVLRCHKDELITLLPDTSPQVDLFDPYT